MKPRVERRPMVTFDTELTPLFSLLHPDIHDVSKCMFFKKTVLVVLILILKYSKGSQMRARWHILCLSSNHLLAVELI